MQGSRNNANAINAVRDDINNFGKIAKQSVDRSSPNPVAPSVILDISGTARTALKGWSSSPQKSYQPFLFLLKVGRKYESRSSYQIK